MLKRFGAALGIFIASVFPMAPATAGGGGGCQLERASSARTKTILLAKFCFTPTLARVPIGSVVTWINNDNVNHTVTAANATWSGFGELATGERVTRRFVDAGVYPYYCLLHPGMAGAVLVGDANGPGAAADVTSGLTNVQQVGARSSEPSRRAGTASSTSLGLWPALAVGLAAGLAGFGVGKRVRLSR